MVLAPSTQVLLEVYGWRNALLILGGAYFHLIIAGFLFKSPSPLSRHAEKSTCTLNETSLILDTSETKGEKHIGQLYDLLQKSRITHFRNISVILAVFLMGTLSCSITGWIIYFIPSCLTKGLTPYEASFLATAAGFAYLIGHFLYIPFVAKNIVNVRGAVFISVTAGVFSLVANRFCSTFVTILISNGLFLLFAGSAFPLSDAYLKSMVNKDDLPKVVGWRLAVAGVFRVLAGFTVGKLWFVVNIY